MTREDSKAATTTTLPGGFVIAAALGMVYAAFSLYWPRVGRCSFGR
ncbi:MAG: hypothetical protein LH624_14105 [Cryobacterium sp.]|nr:hypothetical protein [Cryobacterium sp.]